MGLVEMTGVTEEKVRFGESGTYLQGMMHRGPRNSPAIVLCHPHPNFGGTMDFYLLTDLVREISKEGFTTLRFNYRGTSPSTGTYGGGQGEVEDIVKAAEFLRKQQNVNPQRLGLVGYSFGGSLVIVAAERVKPKVVVSISPQTRPFETRLDVVDYARRISSPIMLIHGKADDIVPYSESEEIHKAMGSASEKAFHLIEGANHLYQGRGKTVVSLATNFLLKNI